MAFAMPLRPWAYLGGVLLTACASSARKENGSSEVTTVRHVDRVERAGATVPLAGERCRGRAASCRCRQPGDDAESEPPADGFKRFEVRLSADGGEAALTSSTLGRFQTTGPLEACFYVDVPAGSQHEVTFAAQAHEDAAGFAPRLALAEYGPRGPFWYDIATVECVGPGGRCNRQGVDAWAARTVNQRRRGRLDPCGSAVVSQLTWQTSGGLADRDGGFYRDLTVRFALEVKRFATQFAPGSTECVPK